MAETQLMTEEDLDDLLAASHPEDEVVLSDGEPSSEEESPSEEPEYQELDAKQYTELQRKAALVERFYTDPQFALETVQDVANKLGYKLERTGGPQQQEALTAPAWVEEAAKKALAGEEDLAFLAPQIAKVAYAISQQQMAPYQQQQARQEEQRKQAEFAQMASTLEQRGVHWQEHENAMLDRLNFLKSALNGGPMTHPQYGSLLEMLYTLTAGNGQAQVAAGQRMARALQNKAHTSRAEAKPAPDVQELIRGAKTEQERWEIAGRDAMAQLRAALRERG